MVHIKNKNYAYVRGVSLLNRIAGIRSRANGWFTLTRKFTLRGRPPPTIFARIHSGQWMPYSFIAGVFT